MRQEQEAMSGEPKTHTPGIEAKLTVAQVNALVNAIEQCWSHAAYPYNGPNPSREGEAAMKALRAAFYGVDLGTPVVARDEAAELRAAVKRFLAAIDARDHFIEHEAELLPADWDAAFQRTGDEITDSVAALRRLAGGEEQE